MNRLFSKCNYYQTTLSKEEIEAELKALSFSNYQNHSRNLISSFDNDGSFNLKFTSPSIIFDYGGIAVLSRLNGHVTTDGKKTVIKATVLPNFLFLIILFVIIALLIAELAGVNVFPNNSRMEIYGGLVLLLTVFYLLIVRSIRSLQKKFEKLFNLKPIV